MNQAYQWQVIHRNPVDLVKGPRVPRFQARVLDVAAARKFVRAARKHRLGPLFLVAIAVGLRLGEVLALRWADVDLKGQSLTVRFALQRVGKKLEFVEPKSDRSRRTVPIPLVAVLALKRHRQAQKRVRLAAGDKWVGDDLISPLASEPRSMIGT